MEYDITNQQTDIGSNVIFGAIQATHVSVPVVTTPTINSTTINNSGAISTSSLLAGTTNSTIINSSTINNSGTVTTNTLTSTNINNANAVNTNALNSASIVNSGGIITTTLDTVSIGATSIFTDTLQANVSVAAANYTLLGFQPHIDPEGGAGGGASCSFDTGSCDNAGLIILNTGAGPAQNTELATIKLNTDLSGGYFIVLTPADKTTGQNTFYAYAASSSKWQFATKDTLNSFDTYRINYVLFGRPA